MYGNLKLHLNDYSLLSIDRNKNGKTSLKYCTLNIQLKNILCKLIFIRSLGQIQICGANSNAKNIDYFMSLARLAAV